MEQGEGLKVQCGRQGRNVDDKEEKLTVKFRKRELKK